jgi:hypothetical protein
MDSATRFCAHASAPIKSDDDFRGESYMAVFGLSSETASRVTACRSRQSFVADQCRRQYQQCINGAVWSLEKNNVHGKLYGH